MTPVYQAPPMSQTLYKTFNEWAGARTMALQWHPGPNPNTAVLPGKEELRMLVELRLLIRFK